MKGKSFYPFLAINTIMWIANVLVLTFRRGILYAQRKTEAKSIVLPNTIC